MKIDERMNEVTHTGVETIVIYNAVRNNTPQQILPLCSLH